MSYLLKDMEKWASRYDSDYFSRENLLNEAKESAKVLKDLHKDRHVHKRVYERALKDTQEKSYDAWWEYKKEKSLKAAFESMREEAKKKAWAKVFSDNESSNSVKSETPPVNEPIITKPIVAEPIVAKPIIDPNIKPTQPTSGGNSSLKPLAIGAAGIGAAGTGAYLYHRYKKKKRSQAEQEKTAGGEYDYFENLNEFKKYIKKNPEAAKRRFSPDDFEYSEDYDEARDWHYSNYKASPEERKLLAEYQRTKKQDESMAEKTQEAYRSQHEKNLKRAKRLENIGLRVGLGGAGLAALSAYSKKLPEKYRMPLGLGGMGLVAGSMIPSGRGEYLEHKSYEKYNQPMNDFNKRQEVRDSNIAYQKYLKNRNEHWAFGVDDEFEKTAAPMFGKGRYIPRNESDDRGRAYDRLVEHERKKKNHDPSYDRKSHREDIEAYDKATQAFDDMVERNKQTKAFRRKHITFPTAISAMIAADALGEKAEGDRSSAKMIGLTAGLVGAYPAFQGARIGIKELKNRYHWSKQENIDKDWAEREKDQDVYDRAYKPWFASRGNERLGK